MEAPQRGFSPWLIPATLFPILIPGVKCFTFSKHKYLFSFLNVYTQLPGLLPTKPPLPLWNVKAAPLGGTHLCS